MESHSIQGGYFIVGNLIHYSSFPEEPGTEGAQRPKLCINKPRLILSISVTEAVVATGKAGCKNHSREAVIY